MSIGHGLNWQNWGDERYADVMYRRAVGELPEMESSKALSRRVADYWAAGDNVLDVGCGAGHYLRSLRRQLGNEFDYTGADITTAYLSLAQKAFAADPRAHFDNADIFNLHYRDHTFDIVCCSNLVQNFPSIVRPLSELVRVARKAVIVRLLCGNHTFLIRDVHPHEPELDASGEPFSFNYYNIYSRAYVKHILSHMTNIESHTIEIDKDYDTANLDNSALAGAAGALPTTTIGGFQANGYIILPWAFLTILKTKVP